MRRAWRRGRAGIDGMPIDLIPRAISQKETISVAPPGAFRT